MSNQDDLLNSFFAEINNIAVTCESTEPKTHESSVITSTSFMEYSDTIVAKAQLKDQSKQRVETAYIPPIFAEVDPEEKKQERLDKFFLNEVANIKKTKPHIRKANGQSWIDETLGEWNENDFRLFVGNLGREVTTEILANQFRQRFTSFTKAKVIENKLYKGSQGYGFVAFSDPMEGIKVMKEMNGKLCGNRPMKIMKSEWQKKELKESEKKEKYMVKTIAKAHSAYH